MRESDDSSFPPVDCRMLLQELLKVVEEGNERGGKLRGKGRAIFETASS